MNKPANPYKRGTLVWKVFEGGWEDLTRTQIAEVLAVDPDAITHCMSKIKKETGWEVPRVKLDKCGRPIKGGT